LKHVHKFLNDGDENFKKFVESKKLLGVQQPSIALMLKDLTGLKETDAIQRVNKPSLDINAFPMFRLPREKWE
jgi:hypothetical protein